MAGRERLTAFTTVCPECGHVGKAVWLPRPDAAACRECGSRFEASRNAYRPVTGDMDDDERAERRRLQMRGASRRYREAHGDEIRSRERDRRRERRLRAEFDALADEAAAQRRDPAVEPAERKEDMKNTLSDMHNLLMEQMEALANAQDGDELESAIKRADAMTGVAQQVTANAANVIKVANMRARMGAPMPAMLGGGGGE